MTCQPCYFGDHVDCEEEHCSCSCLAEKYPAPHWTARMLAALRERFETLTVPGTTLFDAHRWYKLDRYLRLRYRRQS